jgi:hypothetical protein
MAVFDRPFDNAIDRYLRSLDLSTVPVDIDAIAGALGVTSIEPRRLKVEGYLGRSPNQDLIIRFKTGARPERQRFTVAHEVAHIIIARAQGREIQRSVRRDLERNNAEERMANRIAGKLLVPERTLVSQLRGSAPGWRTVDELSRLYRVSRTTMLCRLREVTSVLAVEFVIDLSHERSHKVASFRIAYSEKRSLRFLRPPKDEISALLNSRGVGAVHSIDVDFDGRAEQVRCEGRMSRNVNGDLAYHVIGWHLPSSGTIDMK